MRRMVRTQISIEPAQDAFLKRRARELGISESELIRNAIDMIEQAPRAPKPDLSAWEDELAFLHQRADMAVPQTGRGWTRDELYDDRLERVAP